MLNRKRSLANSLSLSYSLQLYTVAIRLCKQTMGCVSTASTAATASLALAVYSFNNCPAL